ncbi:MAG: hypothetical protein HY391_03045 [Deltaproteobacteria bacterium]|nr:hypothetical protein [Deltaproteobacteria bacterium]
MFDLTLQKRLFTYIKSYKWHLILIFVLGAGVAIVQPLTLRVAKVIVDDILPKKNLATLRLMPLKIIALYFFGGIARYWYNYFIRYLCEDIVFKLRNQLFNHYTTLSMEYFADQATGNMMSRITNDVQVLQTGLSRITQLIKDPLLLLGLLGVAFYHDWQLTLVAMIAGPLIALIISKVGVFCRRYSYISQQHMGDLNSLIQESFQGIRVMKAFGLEKKMHDNFQAKNALFRNAILKSVKFEFASSPTLELIGACAAATLVLYGGIRVLSGGLTLGEFTTVLGALGLMVAPLKSINNLNIDFQRAFAGAERIFEILDTQPTVLEKNSAVELPPLQREIVFDRISFSYPEENGS